MQGQVRNRVIHTESKSEECSAGIKAQSQTIEKHTVWQGREAGRPAYKGGDTGETDEESRARGER